MTDSTATDPSYAAVVLTGGTGRRLGGVAKATLRHAGDPLLEHALAACSDAVETVVVGPPHRTSRPVTWTREDPPGGGPGAGLLAGVDALTSGPAWVLVLAVDMPLVTTATVRRLLAAASPETHVPGQHADRQGAVLVDEAGRLQLCAVIERTALAAARPGDPSGVPVHRLLAGLDLAEVPSEHDEALDLDTPADLRRLEQVTARHDPGLATRRRFPQRWDP